VHTAWLSLTMCVRTPAVHWTSSGRNERSFHQGQRDVRVFP
jgi:hypothetical protein